MNEADKETYRAVSRMLLLCLIIFDFYKYFTADKKEPFWSWEKIALNMICFLGANYLSFKAGPRKTYEQLVAEDLALFIPHDSPEHLTRIREIFEYVKNLSSENLGNTNIDSEDVHVSKKIDKSQQQDSDYYNWRKLDTAKKEKFFIKTTRGSSTLQGIHPSSTPFAKSKGVSNFKKSGDKLFEIIQRDKRKKENQEQIHFTKADLLKIVPEHDEFNSDYRHKRNYTLITSREYVDPHHLEPIMKDFFNWFNNQINKNLTGPEIELFIAETLYLFISIHPFMDANGRTAYLLIDYLTSIHNYPCPIFQKDNLINISFAVSKLRDREDSHFLTIDSNIRVGYKECTLKQSIANDIIASCENVRKAVNKSEQFISDSKSLDPELRSNNSNCKKEY